MPPEGVREVLAAATTEAALPVIASYGLQRVYDQLAARASLRIERYVFQKLQAGTVLATLQGKILGLDAAARRIGGELHWNIK